MDLNKVMQNVKEKLESDEVFRMQRAYAYSLDTESVEDMKVLMTLESAMTLLSLSVTSGAININQASGFVKVIEMSINNGFNKNIDMKKADEITGQTISKGELEQVDALKCENCPPEKKIPCQEAKKKVLDAITGRGTKH
jgi:hypothetical protein